MKTIIRNLLCSMAVCLYASALVARTTVPLGQTHNINLGGTTKPAKAPSRNSSELTVYLEDDEDTLVISLSGQPSDLSFSIKAESAEEELLSDTIYIIEGEEQVIDLSLLLPGRYSIDIEISGKELHGSFELH